MLLCGESVPRDPGKDSGRSQGVVFGRHVVLTEALFLVPYCHGALNCLGGFHMELPPRAMLAITHLVNEGAIAVLLVVSSYIRSLRFSPVVARVSVQ